VQDAGLKICVARKPDAVCTHPACSLQSQDGVSTRCAVWSISLYVKTVPRTQIFKISGCISGF